MKAGTMGRVGVDVGAFRSDVTLGFEDIWRVGGGLHYQLTPDWMLQTGYSHDSSAFKNKNRTVALSIDEQHRLGFGAVHQVSEELRVGVSFEWLHLGTAKIRRLGLRGSYERNDIFSLGLNMNGGVESWREQFGLDKS